MASEFEKAQRKSDSARTTRQSPAMLDHALDATRDVFLKGIAPDPTRVASVLSDADATTRTRVLTRLQQKRGNAYVQRVVAESRGKLNWLQSQTQTEKEEEIQPKLPLQREVGLEEERKEEQSIYGAEIERAQVEPAIPIHPDLAERIKSEGAYGHQLEPAARQEMEDVSGKDLGHIRVHNDGLAGEMVRASETMGFSVGEHIFVSEEQVGSPNMAKRVLAHELGHTLQRGRHTALSPWGYTTHKKITEEVGGLLGMDKLNLGGLRESSDIMDAPLVRLVSAGWRFLAERPRREIKPEGADHGEGGMYKLNLADSASINIRKQTRYLRDVLQTYKEYAELKLKRTARMFLRPLVQKMIDQLGNSLHVAQDRGAHGEGAAGAGHGDRRVRDGYDPDDEAQNPMGLLEAQRNTFDVLNSFVGATGLREPRERLGGEWIFVRRQYARLKERLDYLAQLFHGQSMDESDISAARKQLQAATIIQKDERSASRLAEVKSILSLVKDLYVVPLERKLPAKQLKQPVVQRVVAKSRHETGSQRAHSPSHLISRSQIENEHTTDLQTSTAPDEVPAMTASDGSPSRALVSSLENIEQLASQGISDPGIQVATAGSPKALAAPGGAVDIAKKDPAFGTGGVTLIKNAAAFTAPSFLTRNVPVAKGTYLTEHFAEVQATTAQDADHECYYPAPGDHKDPEPGGQPRSGKKFIYILRISEGISALVKAGEQEHLNDAQRSYKITYKLIADKINSLVGKRFGPATSPADAEKLAETELKKKLPAKLGTNPANWVKMLQTLLDLAAKFRDDPERGWHRLASLRQKEGNKYIKELKEIPGKTKIGKVPSEQVVNYPP